MQNSLLVAMYQSIIAFLNLDAAVGKEHCSFILLSEIILQFSVKHR